MLFFKLLREAIWKEGSNFSSSFFITWEMKKRKKKSTDVFCFEIAQNKEINVEASFNDDLEILGISVVFQW